MPNYSASATIKIMLNDIHPTEHGEKVKERKIYVMNG